MHYLHGRPANDTSGIKLRLSSVPVPYSAGMVAFASMFKASVALPQEAAGCAANGVLATARSSLLAARLREPLPPALQIMPRTNSTLVKNSCCYAGWEPLHGFSTRVHTHTVGRWAQPAAELRSTASSRRAQGQALRRSSYDSHAAVLHAIPNFWGPALPCGCREVYLDRARPTGRSALERVVSLSPQKPQVHAGIHMCNSLAPCGQIYDSVAVFYKPPPDSATARFPFPHRASTPCSQRPRSCRATS